MFRFFKPQKDCQIIRSRFTEENIQKLVFQLYNNAISSGNQRNTVIRKKWWWVRFNSYYPGRFVAVSLNQEKEPQAYLFYRIIDGVFYGEGLYYSNIIGARNLLSFIGSHISSCQKFNIVMPVESQLEDIFPDQAGIQISIKPYMMSRIIDFKEIASCLSFKNPTEIHLQVTDDKQCPWNNGTWAISSSHNQISVVSTDQSADCTASITN